MSDPKEAKRPTLTGPAGLTPGYTPRYGIESQIQPQPQPQPGRITDTREPLYNRYNQPPQRSLGSNFGISNTPRSSGSPVIYNSNDEGSLLDIQNDTDTIMESLEEMQTQLNDAVKKVTESEERIKQQQIAKEQQASTAANTASSAANTATTAANTASSAANTATSAANKASKSSAKAFTQSIIAQTSANNAKQSATFTKNKARQAVQLVDQVTNMVNSFRQEVGNYVDQEIGRSISQKNAAQQANINAKLTAMEEAIENIKKMVDTLAKKKQISDSVLEDIETGADSIKSIDSDIGKRAVSAKEGKTQSQKKKRTMGICFIKFKGSTNIVNTMIRNKRDMNSINPILPVNFNAELEGLGDFDDISRGNYLFIDNFQLRESDFKKMTRDEFIKLILDPFDFIEFIKKLRKSETERVFYKLDKPKLNTLELKIYKDNAAIYAKILFSSELTFNIVNRNNRMYYEYTIMNYEMNKMPIKLTGGPDAYKFDVSEKNTDTKGRGDYLYFEFNIKLILDKRQGANIRAHEIQKVGCDQRKIKIYKLLGSLDGTKSILTYFLGENGAKRYLVDDTKLEKLHSDAKPLPSRKQAFNIRKSMMDNLSIVAKTQNVMLPRSEQDLYNNVRRQQQKGLSLLNVPSNYLIGGRKKQTKKIYFVDEYYRKKHKTSKKNHKPKNTKKMTIYNKNKKTKKIKKR